MRMTIGGALLAIAFSVAPAAAGDVQRSVEVQASPEEVWSVLRDVCSIQDWHPAIASCVEEEDDRTLFRVLQTEDGGTFREQVMQIDDAALFYTYSILESPLPVRGYLSTVSVGPGAADGSAVVVWQSEFSAVGVADDDAAGMIQGIYDAGLAGLQDRFAR